MNVTEYLAGICSQCFRFPKERQGMGMELMEMCRAILILYMFANCFYFRKHKQKIYMKIIHEITQLYCHHYIIKPIIKFKSKPNINTSINQIN